MRVVTLMQVLLGLALLAVIPVVGCGMAPPVTALQAIGGLGVLVAALASVCVSQDRELDLWGWVVVAVAAWTYVACFAVALNGRYGLFGVDLVVGIVSSGLGIWVALRPQPSATHQPGRIAGPTSY